MEELDKKFPNLPSVEEKCSAGLAPIVSTLPNILDLKPDLSGEKKAQSIVLNRGVDFEYHEPDTYVKLGKQISDSRNKDMYVQSTQVEALKPIPKLQSTFPQVAKIQEQIASCEKSPASSRRVAGE